MTRRGRDDDATRIARTFRAEAVASLVAILRSERSPAAARASAATKLLEIGAEQVEPIRVVDLAVLDDGERAELINYLPRALTADECMELLDKLFVRGGITPRRFAKGMRAAVRELDLLWEKQQEQRNRKPLPHRTPTRKAGEAAAGPADVRNAPERPPDALNAEYATHGPPRAPHATPDPGLIAGPGMVIIDMPNAIHVDVGNRVHLLRPGRQVVPRDVAQHPLIKKFAVAREEQDPDAA